MPIKIPKTFARRRSSGNALDEADGTATPSFRVLERPPQSSKSFDGGSKLATATATATARPSFAGSTDRLRDVSYPQGTTALNRGSGGSNTNSTSTGASHDNTSSSRISSSSTLPSSVGGPTPDEHHTPRQPYSVLNGPISQEPAPEPAFSFRAGNRTFSFGARAPKLLSHLHSKSNGDEPRSSRDDNASMRSARNRAMTESSYASTAIAPQLETDVTSSELDGFENMFDNIGKRKSALMAENSAPAGESEALAHPEHLRSAEQLDVSQLAKPAPIYLDGSRDVQGSPRSMGSRKSTDQLMHPTTPPPGLGTFADEETRSTIRRRTDDEIVAREGRMSDPPEPRGTPQSRPGGMASGALKRSSAYRDRRSMTPVDRGDGGTTSAAASPGKGGHEKSASFSPKRLVSYEGQKFAGSSEESSASATQIPRSISPERGQVGSSAAASSSREAGDHIEPVQYPPRASEPRTPITQFGESQTMRAIRDPSDASLFPSASRYSEDEGQDGPLLGRKLPDPRRSESEGYLDTHWPGQGAGAASRDHVSTGSEESINARTTSRSKEQDAPARSFSSQTIQAPGEQSPKLPSPGLNRPGLLPRPSGSPQRPLLQGRLSSEGLATQVQVQSHDDDDEDIPLGILAAHGFPSKARPPVRLTKGGSAPNLSSMSQPDLRAFSASPVPGESSLRDARHSNLPVFARNLPQDPYYGPAPPAAMDSNAYALGRNSFASNSVPDLPPGGLIGVIAGEERNRALRRGNAGMMSGAAGLGMPSSGLAAFNQNTAMVPAASPFTGQPRNSNAMAAYMPYGPVPGMSIADQAQLQMSHQMTEMMWMQMMWMQQMMQMQGMPPGFAPGMMPAPQPAGPQSAHPPTINVIPTPGQAPSRPASVRAASLYGGGSGGGGADTLQMHQRTMSMLDPSMSMSNRAVNPPPRFSQYLPSFHTQVPLLNQGYAASIAPSERSNVGLPSRYRPVSAVPQAAAAAGSGGDASQGRASSMTGGMPPEWSVRQLAPSVTLSSEPKPALAQATASASATAQAQPTAPAPAPAGATATTRRPAQQPSGRHGHEADDEDDDEGWEEMKRKREKSKLTWRFKKQANPLQDVTVPEM